MSIDANPPINLPLNKLLKGEVSLRTIVLSGAASRTVKARFDNRTCALILAITMNHVTGTASLIQVYNDNPNAPPSFQSTIPSATATGVYDGFSASTAEAHAGWLPIFLPPLASMYITSDASATFTVYILEWKL